MSDFDKQEILAVLDLADDVKKARHGEREFFRKKYGKALHELLEEAMIATLFVENSTRTNHSFRAVAGTAKGFVDGFSSEDDTSLKKGETWADTSAMFAGFGYGAIVMRSTTEGLPRWTQEFLAANHRHLSEQHREFNVPFNYPVPIVINGGDGRNQHPTQCFVDLFTIREIARAKRRDLDGLEIALMNDLRYG